VVDSGVVAGLVSVLLDPRFSCFDTSNTKPAFDAFIVAVGCRRRERHMVRFDIVRSDLRELVGLVDFCCAGDWSFLDSVLGMWLLDTDWLIYEN